MGAIVVVILTVIFCFSGLLSVLMMLEVRGRKVEGRDISKFLLHHKLFGRVFTLIFFVILGLMLYKSYQMNEPFTPVIMIHVVVSIALLPMLIFKIMIVRRFKNLSQNLYSLGLIVFLLGFVTMSFSSGFYLMNYKQLTPLKNMNGDLSSLDMDLGRSLSKDLCVKCHSLKPLLKKSKSRGDWVKVVNGMSMMIPHQISNFEMELIAGYLIKHDEGRKLKKRVSKLKSGKLILDSKCTKCHTLERVEKAEFDKNKWMETIDIMVKISKDDNYLSVSEKEDLLKFLSSK